MLLEQAAHRASKRQVQELQEHSVYTWRQSRQGLYSPTHTQLCHAPVPHTTLSSFTHNSLPLFHTNPFSHTTLSHTHTHTHAQNSFTHNSVTHDSFAYNSLKQPVLHHFLCLSSLVRTASTTVFDYWEKLTCGVIGSFIKVHFPWSERDLVMLDIKTNMYMCSMFSRANANPSID